MHQTVQVLGWSSFFARYSVNDVFNFSFGRQLTVLGYEADEAPGLFAVSNAYVLGDSGNSDVNLSPAQTRRNYVDGIRANFNNGQFGFTLRFTRWILGLTTILMEMILPSIWLHR